MVHADRYSNFMWIYELKGTAAKDVIEPLWMTFFRMGFPKKLRTDNGPQFISSEFVKTCRQFNVEQEWSDPHYPTSNGSQWEPMGANGSKWEPMGANGSKWEQVGAHESKRNQMRTHRSKWEQMGAHGRKRMQTRANGHK